MKNFKFFKIGKKRKLKGRDKIGLVIVDFYGVMTRGSYKDTCQWLSKKYGISYKKLYEIIYHKYFSRATLGKITEKESFELPIKELGLRETWQQLRKKHLSFQILNKPVFDFCRQLQRKGFKILLLSKNTPPQFEYAMRKMKIRRDFKNIINTFDLKFPKASPKTISVILKKFRLRPEEVVMTDDQDFNLAAPKRLGVKTILYKNFLQFKRDLLKFLR